MFLKIKCWLKTLCSKKVIEEFIENWLLILVCGWGIHSFNFKSFEHNQRMGLDICVSMCLIENINSNVEHHMNYTKILTWFNII